MAESLSNGALPGANEDLVRLAFYQLLKEGLVECDNETSGPLSSMNRRELARRAGITAFAALPVISSLIVPTAAAA